MSSAHNQENMDLFILQVDKEEDKMQNNLTRAIKLNMPKKFIQRMTKDYFKLLNH